MALVCCWEDDQQHKRSTRRGNSEIISIFLLLLILFPSLYYPLVHFSFISTVITLLQLISSCTDVERVKPIYEVKLKFSWGNRRNKWRVLSFLWRWEKLLVNGTKRMVFFLVIMWCHPSVLFLLMFSCSLMPLQTILPLHVDKYTSGSVWQGFV